MTGIIQNHDHKVLQINGEQDHIHISIGMRPTQSLSDLMKQDFEIEFDERYLFHPIE